jgi:carbamoyl-phosphate synthase large subunit
VEAETVPRREDLKKILLIGSGPIIISQACEFDYSGAQACKALREEGYEVVLVNSNPATIMTDPTMADRTYLEPLTPEVLELIIEKERPDALLPTLGGQTGLNLAMTLSERGILEKYGVQMIGADRETIHKAEDREAFKQAMQKIGLDLPRSGTAYTLAEAEKIAREIGFPVIIRPAFTLGGTGGGIAYNIREFTVIAAFGLEASAVTEILVEESIIGWKEFELEVMRDRRDNVVIICSIENIDPMGIHTGDSITVAPAQTLTDKEYQEMRNAAIACIREIGVETGGSNVQFALNPADGRLTIIEMNPRVSRSSALASKATGFPIAKIAAKLAVGYTLDEIPNDITRETPASFEPVIDYCVVKIPRFAFEKFPESDQTLGISMKSVGEVMAIGRTFPEALGKGIRSLETGRYGLEEIRKGDDLPHVEELEKRIRQPYPDRLFDIAAALRQGLSVERVAELTGVDPWFLTHMSRIVSLEKDLVGEGLDLSPESLRAAKLAGYSDHSIASLTGKVEEDVRRERLAAGLKPSYKLVDTCAAEFEAVTPYYYSSYDPEDEVKPGKKDKIMILGGGPNRIGQGIEFDYCCVHASFALRELGYETIMVNSNPETVSTDYDISDRLYFEPLTLEDVLAIIEKEQPRGVIVQFGGQTPLKLAVPLARLGVPIIGTSPDSIDLAEDRKRFGALLEELGIPTPANGTALSLEEAKGVAEEIGYPVLVRPSYVLGGRAMAIVYDRNSLSEFASQAFLASGKHPILIDKFLEDAVEVDVDALADGEQVIVAGIMEHIEEAGIHSGDSACVLPPYTLNEGILEHIRVYTKRLAAALNVVGLMNIQYAVKDGRVYVLEVNPRASRTVPFVSKATGLPLAKIAAKVMAGETLASLGVTKEPRVSHFSVKEAVFPFNRFPGVDPVLGPEMKSTGEVMGIDTSFGMAYIKSQFGAGQNIPRSGTIFISVLDRYKERIVPIARRLVDLGFSLVATAGTAQVIGDAGVPVNAVLKVHEGRPNIVDLIKNRQVQLVINTPRGRRSRDDQIAIRREALMHQIPTVTTVPGASAVVTGLESLLKGKLDVLPLQEYHRDASF